MRGWNSRSRYVGKKWRKKSYISDSVIPKITSGQRLSRHSRALITWVERGEFLGPAENQFGVFVVLDSKRLQESSTTIERQYGNSEEFEKVTPVGFKPPQQLLLETSSQPRDIVVGRKTEDGVSVKAEIFEVGDILILTKPEFLKVKNGTIPLIAILYMKQIGEVEAGEPSSVG